MFKKIILFLILLIVTPIIARASFFDDLLKNIDHTLNNRTFDNTAITPENKIEDNVNINTDVSSQDNCFLSPLEVGNENNDVWKLQEFLSTLPNIYPEKLVTGYFGNLTKQAVMRFQLKYKKDILEPVGLLKPTGYVGQSTLKKLNQLNSCYQTPNSDNLASQNNQLADANNSTAPTSVPVVNNSQKQQATNISGPQTYQLTEPLGCNKYAWTTNCKKSYYICLTTFLNEQNIDYSNLYVQPKNALSYSCTPQLTLLQADASYQDKLKSFGFSISNKSIPTTDVTDKYMCPQDMFINRWIYNQSTCYHMTNSFNSPAHYVENILFKITSPGYGASATEEKVNTIDICDIKNNTCTTFQKDKHKLFNNANECLTYCATQTKNIETIDINVPCLIYPHAPYTNEPVFITSAYNRQKDSGFWAPSIVYNYNSIHWKLDSNQTRDDIQVFNFNDYSDEFLWPHNYEFQTTNAPSEQPYGLYGQKFFAFKKPGKYQYSTVYTKITSTQHINFHYDCIVTVEDNPKYKIIFLTDQLYKGDFQRLGPNKICDTHAKKLGYNDEFEALLKLDDLGNGGYIYRLPKIYTDNSVADNTTKTLGLSYKGFFCDGAYWRFFASSYSVAGQAKASQFCALPNIKISGVSNQWYDSLKQNARDISNIENNYYESFWYSQWFSFPGSDKLLSLANCDNFSSASSKEGANRIFSPGAAISINNSTNPPSVKYDQNQGSIPCNFQYPIACVEKTAKSDLERQR